MAATSADSFMTGIRVSEPGKREKGFIQGVPYSLVPKDKYHLAKPSGGMTERKTS